MKYLLKYSVKLLDLDLLINSSKLSGILKYYLY